MNKELVISYFNKDISWIENLNNDIKITVYRKDETHNKLSKTTNTQIFSLKNLGREIHTYFYHIYHNYDNLLDYTFFSQDYPFDHWEDIIEVVNGDIDVFALRSTLNMGDFYGYHFNTITVPSERGGMMHTMYPSTHHDSGYVISCLSNGLPHDTTNTLNVDKYWDMFFDEPKPTTYEFIPGAHFCATKDRIHLRPKEFYGKIITLLENDYISAWAFERLICYVFNDKYKIKL